ncbi:unnamed protein product [Alopecurus aequalis]
MLRSTTVAARTTCGAEEEKIKKQVHRITVAEASMGMPSVEAIAMAGFQGTPPGAGCSGDVDGGGRPPEHLRAFEAFLEKVVPVDMIMASRREEDARLRRGGKPRSYDDDMKEKLKLWAKAVAKNTMGRR